MTIDPEFRALIPPLTAEERQQLETNIIRDGCRDALVVWNGVLLDGHHRYEVCTAKNITFRTIEQPCPDRDEAKVWILRHQLGRRNLNDFQRAELAMKLHPLLAQQAEARMLTGKSSTLAPNDARVGKTSTKLAAIAGISEQGMERSICVINRGSPELQAQVRTGQVALSRAAARVRAGEAIHPPRRQPSTPPIQYRKENKSTTALAMRLAEIHRELHHRRVANHDDMKKRSWIPNKINVVAQKEILDWIETTLETLVSELHAHMLKDASGTRASKSRDTSNGEPEHGDQKTQRYTH